MELRIPNFFDICVLSVLFHLIEISITAVIKNPNFELGLRYVLWLVSTVFKQKRGQYLVSAFNEQKLHNQIFHIASHFHVPSTRLTFKVMYLPILSTCDGTKNQFCYLSSLPI